MHRGKVDPGVSELPRGNELSRDHVNRPLNLVSIKPLLTTTTTNFELKQSDSVGRMTVQAHNRFVFCVVVAEFAVNGNQAL